MQVICEIRSRTDGKFIRSFVVDHSTREGRQQTAIEAAAAMEAGHIFFTQPKTGMKVISSIQFKDLTNKPSA
jgi:hypothetical protein